LVADGPFTVARLMDAGLVSGIREHVEWYLVSFPPPLFGCHHELPLSNSSCFHAWLLRMCPGQCVYWETDIPFARG